MDAPTLCFYEVFDGDYQRRSAARRCQLKTSSPDKAYFGTNNRTVASLLPENQEKAKP